MIHNILHRVRFMWSPKKQLSYFLFLSGGYSSEKRFFLGNNFLLYIALVREFEPCSGCVHNEN